MVIYPFWERGASASLFLIQKSRVLPRLVKKEIEKMKKRLGLCTNAEVKGVHTNFVARNR